jgi:hypothetical protein
MSATASARPMKLVSATGKPCMPSAAPASVDRRTAVTISAVSAAVQAKPLT